MAEFCADMVEQRYGRRRILRGCSLYADAGECVGLVGRNGSGKSTLLEVLAGVRCPTGGRVTWQGRSLLAGPVPLRSLVGYVPQTDPLVEELTAEENLRLLTGRSVRAEEPVCRQLRIGEFFKTRTSKLSGGMKRRVTIACALLDRPPVLVMDEPSSALDLHQKALVSHYLLEYRQEGGCLIMSTHDPEEMEQCDRLYLISGGTLEEVTLRQAVQRIKGEEEDE